MTAGRWILGALIIAAPAATVAGQPAPPPAKPKLICRESERQLGSHIRSSRKCKTAEQWQAEDAARDRVSPSVQVTEGQQDGRPAKQPQ